MDSLARDMGRVAKVFETLNENFAGYVDMIRKDIQKHEFKPVELKDLNPRYQVGMAVVIYCEGHLRDGYRATITKMGGISADVQFEDGQVGSFQGNEMIPMHEFPQEEAKNAPFQVDNRVKVTEPLSLFFGRIGTVMVVDRQGLRVMFEGIEGYSFFTFDEVTIDATETEARQRLLADVKPEGNR